MKYNLVVAGGGLSGVAAAVSAHVQVRLVTLKLLLGHGYTSSCFLKSWGSTLFNDRFGNVRRSFHIA